MIKPPGENKRTRGHHGIIIALVLQNGQQDFITKDNVGNLESNLLANVVLNAIALGIRLYFELSNLIIAPVTKPALIFSPIAAQTMKGTAACKKSY